MPLLGSLFCTARLCSAIQIFRVLFDSPVHTWSQLLQGVWYTTPVLLLSGRCNFTLIRVRFRVRAKVKMERMPRGARILSTSHLFTVFFPICIMPDFLTLILIPNSSHHFQPHPTHPSSSLTILSQGCSKTEVKTRFSGCAVKCPGTYNFATSFTVLSRHVHRMCPSISQFVGSFTISSA